MLNQLNYYGKIIWKKSKQLNVKFPYYFLIVESNKDVEFYSYNISYWTQFLNTSTIKYTSYSIKAYEGYFIIEISKEDLLNWDKNEK